MSEIWTPNTWGELIMKNIFASKDDIKRFKEAADVKFEVTIEIVQGGDGKWYWHKLK